MPSKKPNSRLIWDPIKKEYKAIEVWKNNYSVTSQFACGKTQINNIIQHRDRIIKSFIGGENVDMKYHVPHTMPNPDID